MRYARDVLFMACSLASLTLGGCFRNESPTDAMLDMATLGLWNGGGETMGYKHFFTKDTSVPVRQFPITSALVQRGVDEIRGRLYERAVKTLSQAITLDPTNASAWFYRGYAKEWAIRYRLMDPEHPQCKAGWGQPSALSCEVDRMTIEGQVRRGRQVVQADYEQAIKLLSQQRLHRSSTGSVE